MLLIAIHVGAREIMATNKEPQLELVITAPAPHGDFLAYRTRCRSTLGALTQLVAQARHHAVIAAPYFQAGHGLVEGPLADAMHAALKRGVRIDVASTGAGLQTLDVFRQSNQMRAGLRLFRPAANIASPERIGSHAKFCVVDEATAYIGSANLTGPGLTNQFEMGVLVDGLIARQIASVWSYLLEIGVFVEITE